MRINGLKNYILVTFLLKTETTAIPQYDNIYSMSLQAKCIVKMSSIFLPVLRHKDFSGWVTSLHGEKNVSNFFRLF